MENISSETTMMSLLDELYDSVVEDEANTLGINIEEDGFSVKDDCQANFFLRRLTEVNAQKKEIDDVCDKEIEAFVNRVNLFRNSKCKELENTSTFFTTLLEKYAKNQLIESKKKSIKLPFGTLQFKKSSDKYEYEEDKVIKFINDNNLTGLIRTKVELNKIEIKKAISLGNEGVLLIEGKEVDGVTVVPGDTNFSIKL